MMMEDKVLAIPENYEDDLPSTFGDEDALLSVIQHPSDWTKASDTSRSRGGDAASLEFAGSVGVSDSTSTDLRSSELRGIQRGEIPSSDLRFPKTGHRQQLILDKSSLGLIGREEEVVSLRKCMDRVMNKHAEDTAELKENTAETSISKQLLFVGGNSGVGKTTLIRTLEEYGKEQYSGVFAEGKFEMNKSEEPYSGIAKALGQLCSKVLELGDTGKVADESMFEIGDAAELLIDIIPELKQILPEPTAAVSNSGAIFDAENELSRWKYAFRKLARLLTAQVAPVIIFLDDMQWADVSSLQVVDYIISDYENPNPLLIVGCYRAEDVDENSLLYNKIASLREKSAPNSFSLTEIKVESFDENDVSKVLAPSMPMNSEDEIRELSKLCVRRTMGNPFFVIEFLKMLETEGLIQCIPYSKKWEWEIETIESMAMSTANVVILLQSRMRRMERDVQRFLQFAACLGSSFSIETVDVIWKKYNVTKNQTVNDLVSIIEKNEFVEKCGPNKYMFVHDKIQEAALSLTDIVNASFQFDIGTSLYYCLEISQRDEALFSIVDLINNGNVRNRSEFAEANLRAAEKAKGISAFHSASRYAAQGIELLPEDCFVCRRDISLRLHTLAVEMALVLGDIDKVKRYSDVVLKRTDFEPLDVLPMNLAKAKRLSSVELRFDDAIEFCLSSLKGLGCKFVWNKTLLPMQAVAVLVRTIKTVKKKAKGGFHKTLRRMDNPKQKAIAVLLSQTLYAAYNAANANLNILCTCELVNSTLKYGVSDFSAFSFTVLGFFVRLAQNDYPTSSQFLKIALEIQRIYGGPRGAECAYSAHAYGFTWVDKLEKSAQPMLDGYNIGTRGGETAFAHWNLVACKIFLPYQMGQPIGPILEECPGVLSRCEDHAQSGHASVVRVFYQLLLLLMYPSTQPMTTLNGDMYDEKEDEGKGAVHVGTVHLAKGELLIVSGSYEAAAERAIEKGDFFENAVPAFFMIMMETFHRAISLYAMARKTKQRKYKTGANKLRLKLEKMQKAGNPNLEHYIAFLEAEKMALAGKLNEASEQFQQAIKIASANGHLLHEALANERYSDFLSQVQKQQEEASFRMKEAIRLYEEWGAIGKTRILQAQLNEWSSS